MKLHLLRHAKTDQSSPTGRDFDRKLLPRGIAQCADLRNTLPSELQMVEVWCSSSARTRATYALISEGGKLQEATFSDALYLASRSELFQAITAHNGDQDLLIIGHNFGISDLAAYLIDEHVELQTGGYICISFDIASWQELSRGLGTTVLSYRPEVR